MPRYQIPDRWMEYTSVGKRIGETPFVALKCPLDKHYFKDVPPSEHFCPNNVKSLLPEIALIIDLTFTTKYYNKKSFEGTEIEYQKIPCVGHVIPAPRVLKRFFNVVDRFLSQNNDSGKVSLIGVHCTHGVNRTGFFICCYMISKLGYNCQSAIAEFNLARGHNMERQNYIDTLKTYELNPLSFVSVKNDAASEEEIVPQRNFKGRYRRRNFESNCDRRPRSLTETHTSNVKPRFINRLENSRFPPNDVRQNVTPNYKAVPPYTSYHNRQPSWNGTYESRNMEPVNRYPHSYNSFDRFPNNLSPVRFDGNSENPRNVSYTNRGRSRRNNFQ